MFKRSIFKCSMLIERNFLEMLLFSLGFRIYRMHPFLYLLAVALSMKIQQTVKFNEHNFMVSSQWITEESSQTTLTEHNFALHMLC